MKHRGLLLTTIAVVALAGCAARQHDTLAAGVQSVPAGQSGATHVGPENRADPAFATPGFPGLGALADPERQASDFVCTFPLWAERLAGDVPLLNAPSASLDTNNHTATLSAPAGQTSWAVYQYAGRAAERDTGYFDVNVYCESGGPLYIGLSDYDHKAWEWRKVDVPAATAAQYIVEGLVDRDYSSPGGSCYLALLTYDGTALELDQVNFGLNTRYAGVFNFESGYGEGQGLVNLSWDPADGADGYLICVSSEGGHGDVFVEGGETSSFVHDAATIPGLPPQPNTLYDYRIRAHYPDGLTSLTNTAFGGTGLKVPAAWFGYASNRFGIQIGWEPCPDATGYEIYKDFGATLVAAVDAATTDYFDFQPAVANDYSTINYSVYPVDANGRSIYPANGVGTLLDGSSYELDANRYLLGHVAAYCYDGRPCFATADPTGNVWFEVARQIVPDDVSDFDPYYLDFGSSDISAPLALEQLGGFPAVAACSAEHVLLYGYCDAENPTPVGTWHTSVASGNLNSTTSVDLVDMDGVPGVVVSGEDGLRFFTPADGTPQGPTDWSSYFVVEGLVPKTHCSMVRSGDNILIAYSDVDSNLSMAVSTAFPPQSAADWITMLVDADSIVQTPISLAIDAHNRPGIAYAAEDDGGTSSTLRYAYSHVPLPLGLPDWDDMEVKSITNKFCGRSPALLLIDSRPTIISYQDDMGTDKRILMLNKALLDTPTQTRQWDSCNLASGIGSFDSSFLNAVRLSSGGIAIGYTDKVASKIKMEYYGQIVH